MARIWTGRAAGPARERTQALHETTHGQRIALSVLCTLLFLTFLDSTIVSVALGDVQSSLQADPNDLQWVVCAYTLTFASIMLACGMIGDELGR